MATNLESQQNLELNLQSSYLSRRLHLNLDFPVFEIFGSGLAGQKMI
jgi:hypothetical protein